MMRFLGLDSSLAEEEGEDRDDGGGIVKGKDSCSESKSSIQRLGGWV